MSRTVRHDEDDEQPAWVRPHRRRHAPLPPVPPSRRVAPEGIRQEIIAGAIAPTRACDGKARFTTYAKAERARAKWAARDPADQGLQVYACPFCATFHLGHGAHRRSA